jgi:hypothetical protein
MAHREKVLSEMVNTHEFVSNRNFFSGIAPFERSMSLFRQGLTLKSNMLWSSEKSFLTTLDGENTFEFEVLSQLGKGGCNKVHLVWSESARRYLAMRESTSFADEPEVVIRNTNRGIFSYNVLKKNSTEEELKLVEYPDVLLKDNSDKIFMLRELAVHGDLFKKGHLFKDNPRDLLRPLLQQLELYIRNGIAMGDVKPANINIHDDQGKPIPKFSDLEEGLCTEFSTQEMIRSWKALRGELKEKAYSEEEIKRVLYTAIVEKIDFYFGEDVSTQKIYDDFLTNCVEIAAFPTTIKFSFGNSKSYLDVFSKNVENELLETLFSLKEGDCEQAIEKCIQRIVKYSQNADVRATGMTLIVNLLGMSIYSKYNWQLFFENTARSLSYIRDYIESPALTATNSFNDSFSSLRKESKSTEIAVEFQCKLIKDLKDTQMNLPESKRLSHKCIEFIVAMAIGETSSDDDGIGQIQDMIEELK